MEAPRNHEPDASASALSQPSASRDQPSDSLGGSGSTTGSTTTVTQSSGTPNSGQLCTDGGFDIDDSDDSNSVDPADHIDELGGRLDDDLEDARREDENYRRRQNNSRPTDPVTSDLPDTVDSDSQHHSTHGSDRDSSHDPHSTTSEEWHSSVDHREANQSGWTDASHAGPESNDSGEAAAENDAWQHFENGTSSTTNGDPEPNKPPGFGSATEVASDDSFKHSSNDGPSFDLSDIESVDSTTESTDSEDDSDEDSDDDSDLPDAAQEYIHIKPVREEIDTGTVHRELYGLHKFGDGRKLPFDLELHFDSIEGVSNFEFIIFKPNGKDKFEFFFGPGDRGDANCDRLESVTRSQYPDNYEFERDTFDITNKFDETPHMVRFEGRERRRKDWMTTLTRHDSEETERSPLANLMESAIQTDGAVLYQVIFEPRPDWSRKAERQKGLLKQGVHSQLGLMFKTIVDTIFGVNEDEERVRASGDTPQGIGGSMHETQTSGMRNQASRMSQIDLKDPAHTFNVSIRAATSTERAAVNIEQSLNNLSGNFYEIQGEHLERNENEYKRMLNHSITYPNGYELSWKQKPFLVCSIEELANFITVPSIDSLPKASRAGTGGKPTSQSPLTSPNEEIFRQFDSGMTIGRIASSVRSSDDTPHRVSAMEGKDEWWHYLNHKHSVGLSADHLTQHYLRAATTGSGKTVATINDALSTHANLHGPTFIIDPKGGDMCENYLRCHRTLFGTLHNVEYIKMPGDDGRIPAIPFFDIRPLVQGAGRDRETAIQNIIDHYFQLLNFALGKDTVEQAFVANEILKNLIKAGFDPKYGQDHFSIGWLLQTAQDFQEYGKQVEKPSDTEVMKRAIPKVSDGQVLSILRSHLLKDERQFVNTTDAVLNRIRTLKEHEFIWNMLSVDIPDEFWDEKTAWYDTSFKKEDKDGKADENGDGEAAGDGEGEEDEDEYNYLPLFDLQSILNSNKVVLIDTGEVHEQSSEIFTAAFLSHLWTAVRSLWTPNDDNYICNVIIEEASNIARTEIVYRDLLPKGREFNLSLGLIMQYPEQVLADDPHSNRRAYREILNNVNTKIIGNIATDDILAESLFHEDLDDEEIKDRIAGLRRGEWLVQLPSTGFHDEKPELLTLNPLPIPPGHSEGPHHIQSRLDHIERRSQNRYTIHRAHPAIDVDEDFIDFDDVIDGKDDSDEEDGENEDGKNSETTTNDGASASDPSVGIPPDEDLTPYEALLLTQVFEALADDAPYYNPTQPMSDLPQSDFADNLIDKGFIEKRTMGNNEVYYQPTGDGIQKAKDAENFPYPPEEGLEHGTPSVQHTIGVNLAKRYYEDLGYDVELYHKLDQGEYDVYAKPTKDSPDDRPKLVEVELSPTKSGHIEDDYGKLSKGYGDAVWVVENFNGFEDLRKQLLKHTDELPSIRTGNLNKINEQLDDPGISEAISIHQLREWLS